MSDEHDNHGNTRAAWTAVIILIVAATVGSIAVVLLSPAMGIAAVVIGIVGVAAGKVMSASAAKATSH